MYVLISANSDKFILDFGKNLFPLKPHEKSSFDRLRTIIANLDFLFRARDIQTSNTTCIAVT